MQHEAQWWKEELAEACEKLKKDTKEVGRVHELANACGKWSAIIKNQLEAMKMGGVKPTEKNMSDILS